MLSVVEVAARLDVPLCTGGCGLSDKRHITGDVFMGVVHYAERSRMTKRTLRRLLILIARQQRASDPLYLNVPLYDWWYTYSDAVTAAKLAAQVGYRLPSRLADPDRRRCAAMANHRGVRLSRDYPNVYAWLQAASTQWVDA